MASDPKDLRISDAADPDRADKFARSIKRTASNGNQVIRNLIDAFNAYVDEHGHGPAFPVTIIPAATSKATRAAEPKPPAKSGTKNRIRTRRK